MHATCFSVNVGWGVISKHTLTCIFEGRLAGDVYARILLHTELHRLLDISLTAQLCV